MKAIPRMIFVQFVGCAHSFFLSNEKWIPTSSIPRNKIGIPHKESEAIEKKRSKKKKGKRA